MIENMQYAISQDMFSKYEQKPLFACLFCGGAKSCDNLRATGVNALCLSWAQNNEKPKLSKIIPILDNLLLKSDALANAVVICSELETNQRLSKKRHTCLLIFLWLQEIHFSNAVNCIVLFFRFGNNENRS